MTATGSILVTGATGFIGSRLTRTLVERGDDVRAMTRRPDADDGPGTAVGADVHDAGTLPKALEGIDIAYYLVHSLDVDDFEHKDAKAARAFGEAAADAGVRQIVYLGGLGAEGADLSPHLRSRREVESLLAAGGVPVTVLRAAIVVGAGGISWELTRQLVKNLPAMVVPRWVSTRTQPIAVDDVVRYLVGVAGEPDAVGRVFEIGGPDRLSYLEMLEIASETNSGRRVPIVRVPVLTPRLSSYWLALVTDVDVTTVAYAAATLATGNVMLAFAALLLGALVGLERRATGGIQAPIITHVVWSVSLLFLLPALFG